MSSFSNETINKAVRDLITAATPDVLAIRAQQNAPLPQAKPFATVQISLLPPLGWADLDLTNNISGNDLDELISEMVVVRASVNYFRSSDDGLVSAFDRSVAFKTFLQGTLAQQQMTAAGLGLSVTSDVRNLTALENDKWEERAQMDLNFFALSERTDLIMEIKSVLVTGEVEEGNVVNGMSIPISNI